MGQQRKTYKIILRYHSFVLTHSPDRQSRAELLADLEKIQEAVENAVENAEEDVEKNGNKERHVEDLQEGGNVENNGINYPEDVEKNGIRNYLEIVDVDVGDLVMMMYEEEEDDDDVGDLNEKKPRDEEPEEKESPEPEEKESPATKQSNPHLAYFSLQDKKRKESPEQKEGGGANESPEEKEGGVANESPEEKVENYMVHLMNQGVHQVENMVPFAQSHQLQGVPTEITSLLNNRELVPPIARSTDRNINQSGLLLGRNCRGNVNENTGCKINENTGCKINENTGCKINENTGASKGGNVNENTGCNAAECAPPTTQLIRAVLLQQLGIAPSAENANLNDNGMTPAADNAITPAADNHNAVAPSADNEIAPPADNQSPISDEEEGDEEEGEVHAPPGVEK
jgi:hypothetical protein